MGVYDDIVALPKHEQLDAALFLLRSLLRPDIDALVHYATLFGLTRSEATVLHVLAANADRVCSKEMILSAVSEITMKSVDEEPCMKIVDVYICKLRRKLPKAGIETIWGIGYRIGKDFAQEIAPPVTSECCHPTSLQRALAVKRAS